MNIKKAIAKTMNVISGIALGGVVAAEIVEVSSAIALDDHLKNKVRREERRKVPGHLFKQTVVVDGYGNVVTTNANGKEV